MAHEEPRLAVHWEATLGDLFDRTQRFPKSARFTFAQRIENLALDVLEALVRARFGDRAATRAALTEVDVLLARLRVLVRLSHARALLDHRGYEQVARNLDEAGRMVGGWRKAVG